MSEELRSDLDSVASEIEQGFSQRGGWKSCRYLLGKLDKEYAAEIERLRVENEKMDSLIMDHVCNDGGKRLKAENKRLQGEIERLKSENAIMQKALNGLRCSHSSSSSTREGETEASDCRS